RNRGQGRSATTEAPSARGRPVSLGQMERDDMRFHVVLDRSVTFGFLTLAACGLGITACASQAAPGAASSSSATSPANNTTSPADNTASPSSASVADTGACVTSQLKISLTNTSALAGQAGGYLKFTNNSGTPCRMT